MTEFKINSKNSQNQLEDKLEGKTHSKQYQNDDKLQVNLIQV